MIVELAATLCLAGVAHERYARMDTTALRRMYRAAVTREDSLQLRYRLYPLTRERTWIERIPAELSDGSPRELALLSALWAWRIAGSAPWNVVRLGRRSVGLLDRALAAAPDDPLVRLIEAQSLIFRPGIAGGDVDAAIARLRALRDALGGDCAVSPVEVDYWLWYAMEKSGSVEAVSLRERLLAAHPPPLYVEMLDATR